MYDELKELGLLAELYELLNDPDLVDGEEVRL